MRSLPTSFYARPTLEVAHDLLGRELWVSRNGRRCGGRIVEVEAYVGEDDPACHAHRGIKPRNRVMYGLPGHAYVYFTYGNHWMLNFVTERAGFPAAVLIRAIEPLEGLPIMRRRRLGIKREYDLCNGPGKLTAALGITGDDNGSGLRGPRLSLTGAGVDPKLIATSGRVGIGEAASDWPWRFFIDGNPWVSVYRNVIKPHRSSARQRTRSLTHATSA